jgi:hypothetical protein
MTVRELLKEEKDYLEVRIIKDGETLFWNEIDGLYDVDNELLDMEVWWYTYNTEIVRGPVMSAVYTILVIEVK